MLHEASAVKSSFTGSKFNHILDFCLNKVGMHYFSERMSSRGISRDNKSFWTHLYEKALISSTKAHYSVVEQVAFQVIKDCVSYKLLELELLEEVDCSSYVVLEFNKHKIETSFERLRLELFARGI